MKKRAAKAGLIFLEVAAIVIAVVAAGVVFLFWRVERAPVSLAMFKPSLEYTVSRRLPKDYRCDIGSIELARDQQSGDYLVQLSAVKILDDENTEAASASDVMLTFSAGSLISGSIGPRTMSATNAKFRIVRNEALDVKIPAVGGRRKTWPLASALPSFLDRNPLSSTFERAEIADAEITFVDIASGRSWTTQDASVLIERQTEGLSAAVSGNLDIGGSAASIRATANYDNDSQVISTDIDGSNFPIGDILTMFYGERAAVLDAPVSGTAAISLTSSGDVLSSSFDARIDGGALRFGATPIPVKFIEWETDFAPEKNEFVIDRFAFDVNGNNGALQGVVNLVFGEDVRDPERIGFELEADALTINIPSRLSTPLTVDRGAIVGGYDIADRKINLDELSLSLLDVAAAGNFSMSFPRANDAGVAPSPEVFAQIAIDGALDPQRLLKLWPMGVAMGARDWVAERLETATIENINAQMQLAEGAIDETRLMPDDAMNITFDVSDAKAYYVTQMTPITGGSGSGVLRGNSFDLKVDRANVGKVTIAEGEVVFPVFIPKWEPTYIRFLATGRSDDMLGILDQEPLILMSKINLDPAQFRGAARARVEIMRPNKRDVPAEDYRYSGTATFDDMQVSGLTADAELTAVKGVVDLKPRSVKVTADGFLSETPIDVVWRQNFFVEDGPSSFDIAGTVDSTTGDLLGIPTRQYVRGPVAFSAKALGDIGSFKSITANADFKDAMLRADAFDWRKPAGEAAGGAIDIEFTADGVNVKKAEITGVGVSIAGNLQFKDNALVAAVFPTFELENTASLHLSAQRKPTGELALTAIGDYLNVGPILEDLTGAGMGSGGDQPINWGPGLVVTARIDQMRMRENVNYNNTSLDLWRNESELQTLDFSAFDEGGSPLKVTMAHTGDDDGPVQSIEAKTRELGQLLKAIFGYSSIEGGDGSMKIDLVGPDTKGISGVIEAQDLRVVNAPLLARLFAAGSLEGLSDLMNGGGIELTQAYGEFSYVNNVVSIKDFHATGPSVGMTADGAVAVGEGGEVQLNGAVAPLYQINSALGAAPIIGDILIGKKGEGVLALSYSVSGKRAAPNVFINPLSALTPGIFRNLFDPIAPVNDNEPDTVPGADEEAAAREPGQL